MPGDLDIPNAEAISFQGEIRLEVPKRIACRITNRKNSPALQMNRMFHTQFLSSTHITFATMLDIPLSRVVEKCFTK